MLYYNLYEFKLPISTLHVYNKQTNKQTNKPSQVFNLFVSFFFKVNSNFGFVKTKESPFALKSIFL